MLPRGSPFTCLSERPKRCVCVTSCKCVLLSLSDFEGIKSLLFNKEVGGYLIQLDGQWRGPIFFYYYCWFHSFATNLKKKSHTTTVIEALGMFRYIKHELLPHYRKVSKITLCFYLKKKEKKKYHGKNMLLNYGVSAVWCVRWSDTLKQRGRGRTPVILVLTHQKWEILTPNVGLDTVL